MLQDDDTGLILRPNKEGKHWNGTVDVQAVVMPRNIMTEDNQTEMLHIIYGLIVCFNLLNSDEEFATRVSDELEKMIKSGELNVNPRGGDNVVHMDQWTKTHGNA
jgi:hypothetical protein